MNPVIVEQNRMRRAAATVARFVDDERGGPRIFGAAAEALMALEAPRYSRLAANLRVEHQRGIVTEYGNSTPPPAIIGFNVKSTPDESSPAPEPGQGSG